MVTQKKTLFTYTGKLHVMLFPLFKLSHSFFIFIRNHEYIPNWDTKDKKIYPTGKHTPPDDIGANFYPLLGCYSSKSSATVNQHFQWIQVGHFHKFVCPSHLNNKISPGCWSWSLSDLLVST